MTHVRPDREGIAWQTVMDFARPEWMNRCELAVPAPPPPTVSNRVGRPATRDEGMIAIPLSGKVLSSAIVDVKKAISRNSDLPPILEHVLVTQDAERLTLTGTDLEIAIQVAFPVVPIGGDGLSVAVPVGPFRTALKIAGNNPVTFVPDDDRAVLTVDTLQGRAELKGMFPNEFPRFGEGEEIASFEVDLSLWADVARSVATDQRRPVLTMVWVGRTKRCPQCGETTMKATCYSCGEVGAHPTTEPDASFIVAADGFRLAVAPIDLEHLGLPDLFIPGRAIKKAAQVIDAGQPVTLGVYRPEGSEEIDRVVFRGQAGKGILARAKAKMAVSAVVAVGQPYPDFQQVIPAEDETPSTFFLAASDLVEAVRSLEETAKAVNGAIQLLAEDGHLRVGVYSHQYGRQEHRVAIRGLSEPSAVAVDVDYLLDAMAVAGNGEASIRMGLPEADGARWKPRRPLVVESGVITQVIMPKKVGLHGWPR